MKLTLTSPQTATGATSHVELAVTNADATSVGGTNQDLRVELTLPAALAHPTVVAAVAEALKSPDNQAALPEDVQLTGVRGTWSAWARTSRSSDHVSIWLRNDLAPDGRRAGRSERGSLEPGETLYLRLPLAPASERTHLSVGAVFRTRESQESANVELWVLPDGTTPPRSAPIVYLETDQESPTALHPGAAVQIRWRVERGVSGKLLGPLAGGAQVLTLENGTAFELNRGAIRVRAVSHATYLLQAVVEGEDGFNVLVVRTLIIDVFSAEKLAALRLVPSVVLPYGRTDAYWAAWGVNRATLRVGQNFTRTVLGSDSDGSVYLDGDGAFPLQTTDQKRLNVRLDIEGRGGMADSISRECMVLHWEFLVDELPMRLGPVQGMAVAATETAGHLCVCGWDNICAMDVGPRDMGAPSKTYTMLNVPKTGRWLGLISAGESFVALGRADSGLQLVRFTVSGDDTLSANVEEAPVTLPSPAPPLGIRQEPPMRMAALGTRVYLVIGRSGHHSVYPPQAWSIDLATPRDGWTPEPMLRGFEDCHVLAVGDALYALHTGTGALFRFEPRRQPDVEGTLGVPGRPASAVNEAGASLVTYGIPVAVGPVLVVLGSGRGATAEDQVYNPQTNQWTSCGQDPRVRTATAVAYRGGDSLRLWLLSVEATYTLAAGEVRLFARDYLSGNPPWEVPAIEPRTFVIHNHGPCSLVPVGEGLTALTLDDSLQHVEAPKSLAPDESGTVKVWARGAVAGSGTCLWRVEGAHVGGREFLVSVEFKAPAGEGAWELVSRMGSAPVEGDTPEWLEREVRGEGGEIHIGTHDVLYRLVEASGFLPETSRFTTGDYAAEWGFDVDLEGMPARLGETKPSRIDIFADTVRSARSEKARAAVEALPIHAIARRHFGVELPATLDLSGLNVKGEGALWVSSVTLMLGAVVAMEWAPETAARMLFHVADRAAAAAGGPEGDEWRSLAVRAEALALAAATLKPDVFKLGMSRRANHGKEVGWSWGDTEDPARFDTDASSLRGGFAEEIQMRFFDREAGSSPRSAMLAATASLSRAVEAWSASGDEETRLLLLGVMTFDVVLAGSSFNVPNATLRSGEGSEDPGTGVAALLRRLEKDAGDLLPIARDRFDLRPDWPIHWNGDHHRKAVPDLLHQGVTALAAEPEKARAAGAGLLSAMCELAGALSPICDLQERVRAIVDRTDARGGGRLSAKTMRVEPGELRALAERAGVTPPVATIIRYRSESERIVDLAIAAGLDGARAYKAARTAVLWSLGADAVRWPVLLRLLAQWAAASQWAAWTHSPERPNAPRWPHYVAMQNIEQRHSRLSPLREWAATYESWLGRPSAAVAIPGQSLADIRAAGDAIEKEAAGRFRPGEPWVEKTVEVSVPVSGEEVWWFASMLFVEIPPDHPAFADYRGVLVRSVRFQLHGVESVWGPSMRVTPPELCVRRDETGWHPFLTLHGFEDLGATLKDGVLSTASADLTDRVFLSPFGCWQLMPALSKGTNVSKVVFEFECSVLPFE